MASPVTALSSQMGGYCSQFFDEDVLNIDEIRTLLNGPPANVGDKFRAMERVVALFAAGLDVSLLFPDVIKCVAEGDLHVKRAVLLMLAHQAARHPDDALLAVNALQKDLCHADPFFRSLALKGLSNMHVPLIAPLLVDAIANGARDPSPYARRAAALAILKAAALDPAQMAALEEQLGVLLNDDHPMVLGSAAASFSRLCPDRFEALHPHYRKLCRALPNLDAWGQVAAMDALLRYACSELPVKTLREGCHVSGSSSQGDLKGDVNAAPAVVQPSMASTGADASVSSAAAAAPVGPPGAGPPSAAVAEAVDDLRLLLRHARPLLHSTNAGVVLSAVSLFWVAAPRAELPVIVGPLLALLGPQSGREVAFCVLYNVRAIVSVHPELFRPFLQHFFLKLADTTGAREAKLDILVALASNENVRAVLDELQSYFSMMDDAVVEGVVCAVARLGQQLPAIEANCVKGLAPLCLSRAPIVAAAALHAVRFFITRNPQAHASVLGWLGANCGSLVNEDLQAEVLTMLGCHSSHDPALRPVAFQALRRAAIACWGGVDPARARARCTCPTTGAMGTSGGKKRCAKCQAPPTTKDKAKNARAKKHGVAGNATAPCAKAAAPASTGGSGGQVALKLQLVSSCLRLHAAAEDARARQLAGRVLRLAREDDSLDVRDAARVGRRLILLGPAAEAGQGAETEQGSMATTAASFSTPAAAPSTPPPAAVGTEPSQPAAPAVAAAVTAAAEQMACLRVEGAGRVEEVAAKGCDQRGQRDDVLDLLQRCMLPPDMPPLAHPSIRHRPRDHRGSRNTSSAVGATASSPPQGSPSASPSSPPARHLAVSSLPAPNPSDASSSRVSPSPRGLSSNEAVASSPSSHSTEESRTPSGGDQGGFTLGSLALVLNAPTRGYAELPPSRSAEASALPPDPPVRSPSREPPRYLTHGVASSARPRASPPAYPPQQGPVARPGTRGTDRSDPVQVAHPRQVAPAERPPAYAWQADLNLYRGLAHGNQPPPPAAASHATLPPFAHGYAYACQVAHAHQEAVAGISGDSAAAFGSAPGSGGRSAAAVAAPSTSGALSGARSLLGDGQGGHHGGLEQGGYRIEQHIPPADARAPVPSPSLHWSRTALPPGARSASLPMGRVADRDSPRVAGAYGQPAAGAYSQPVGVYGRPASAYGQTMDANSQPAGAYGQTMDAYSQRTGAHGQTMDANSQRTGAYGQTMDANSQRTGAYRQALGMAQGMRMGPASGAYSHDHAQLSAGGMPFGASHGHDTWVGSTQQQGPGWLQVRGIDSELQGRSRSQAANLERFLDQDDSVDGSDMMSARVAADSRFGAVSSTAFPSRYPDPLPGRDVNYPIAVNKQGPALAGSGLHVHRDGVPLIRAAPMRSATAGPSVGPVGRQTDELFDRVGPDTVENSALAMVTHL